MTKVYAVTAGFLGWVSGACVVLAILSAPASVLADDGTLTPTSCGGLCDASSIPPWCCNGCPAGAPPCATGGCNAVANCNCTCQNSNISNKNSPCGCY